MTKSSAYLKFINGFGERADEVRSRRHCNIFGESSLSDHVSFITGPNNGSGQRICLAIWPYAFSERRKRISKS